MCPTSACRGPARSAAVPCNVSVAALRTAAPAGCFAPRSASRQSCTLPAAAPWTWTAWATSGLISWWTAASCARCPSSTPWVWPSCPRWTAWVARVLPTWWLGWRGASKPRCRVFCMRWASATSARPLRGIWPNTLARSTASWTPHPSSCCRSTTLARWWRAACTRFLSSRTTARWWHSCAPPASIGQRARAPQHSPSRSR